MIMKRRTLLKGLAATCAVCGPLGLPVAAAALDERELGKEVFASLRDDGEILFDSPYYEHMNEIGDVLAQTVRSRYPDPIRYFVVRGDSANAFSVPGGNIYINEPLLRMANNRDELAGVMAHETGHMVLHHVARQVRNAQTLGIIGTLGSILGQILLGPIGSLASDYATQTALSAQDMNLSRHIEAQADEEGARIMAASGVYNPWGMVWFFEIMEKTYGDKGAFWERSHPFDSARIADLEHLFASDPQTFGSFQNTKAVEDIYW